MPNFNEIAIKQQKTITSLEVAEMLGKEHKLVIRDVEGGKDRKGIIEVLTENQLEPSNYFLESSYKDGSGKRNKCYEVTKMGCELLGNKQQGEKGILFTAKYVKRFNDMEELLKEQKKAMCLEDVLIAQLQDMKAVKEQVNQATYHALEAKHGTEEVKEQIQGIREVISLDTTSWRTDVTDLINKIATYRGGTHNIYQETRREAYELLSKRFGVNLEQRLTNKRRRMADEGICKSRRDKLSKIDVIADDKKLIEGFVIVVKEMAIKYGVDRRGDK